MHMHAHHVKSDIRGRAPFVFATLVPPTLSGHTVMSAANGFIANVCRDVVRVVQFVLTE